MTKRDGIALMLHQALMFRFDETGLALPAPRDRGRAARAEPSGPTASRARLAAMVCGNVLLGAALLGGLLLVPHMLSRLLGLS
jgi:hypothetical protein